MECRLLIVFVGLLLLQLNLCESFVLTPPKAEPYATVLKSNEYNKGINCFAQSRIGLVRHIKNQSKWSLSAKPRDEKPSETHKKINRREMIIKSCGKSFSTISSSLVFQKLSTGVAWAEIIDETSKYGGDAIDSAYSNLVTDALSSPTFPNNQADTEVTDEITIVVPAASFTTGDSSNSKSKIKPFLGIELGEVIFRTNRRIFIKSIAPDSIASTYGIKPNLVLVSLNNQSTERTDRKGVQIMVERAISNGDDLRFVFREPGAFQNQIRNMDSSSQTITTQVAPAGDTTQRNANGSVKFGEKIREQTDQKLSVSQLKPPLFCKRQADIDDLLEISYTGTVLETGKLFDGSTININGNGSVPGRAGDITVFFVLGKQPFGQFPPGWDVGLLGMCVGERRRIVVPPVLGYGNEGVPRRGIPPNATLIYDVSMVSINGLATP